MKNILIMGAGLSASTLIQYLLEKSSHYNWSVTVGDIDLELARQKVNGIPNGSAIHMDIKDTEKILEIIRANDVIISMLPARFHFEVARMCIDCKKHMLTASYVSPEVKSLDEEAREKGIILLNELGVDPGIDHMSAMKVINRLKNNGANILSFVSNCGGLVAPEYDNNPWNYKFTWNPRNVVMAGQGTAKFIRNGKYKHIPYHKLFKRILPANIPGAGDFEFYANRDSLSYREIYGIEDIPTMYRGTLRRPGYCRAWDVFVQLGCTDDTYIVENLADMSWREFINSFMRYSPDITVEQKLAEYLGIDENDEIMKKLEWIGIFSDEKIGLADVSPAKVLQHLLEPKWKLEDGDKDMIVMQHIFQYEINGSKKELISSLVVKGKDNIHTAMSMTVGLPLAIATRLVMTGQLTDPGVHVPVRPEFYEPILDELKEYGIEFVEEEKNL